MRLRPLQQQPPHAEWFFAVMRDITATTCRYVREDDGRIGGPIGYQRLRQTFVTDLVNDGGGSVDHSHDRSTVLPAEGTRCAVLIIGGEMERGMAFPEILS